MCEKKRITFYINIISSLADYFTFQPVIQPPKGHLVSWQPQNKNLSLVLANGINHK